MIRNILLSVVLSIGVLLSFSSCKKETVVVSTGEAITNELKDVIKKQSVTRVYAIRGVLTPSIFDSESGRSWRLENGFFGSGNPNQHSYNLTYLLSYTVSEVYLNTNTRAVALLLYF